jgi:hypothetical protein
LTSRRCASCALSQEEQQAPPDGMRLQQLDDKIYVDVITLRNATTQRAHTFKIHLPPIAPQFIINGERVPLSAALQVRIVVMLCTTAQSIAIKVSVDDESVGELAPIRVESELSTALDFDERGGAELAKGFNGHRVRRHVARPAGRRQAAPAGRCSRRTISPTSRWRRAGRPAAAQEHRIGFRGISGRADALLPRDRAGAVWLAQVGAGQSR